MSNVDVIVMDVFRIWYESLDETDAKAVYRYISLLEAMGTTLDHPYSSAIKESQYALRELRVQSKGHPLRILYAFDPKRQAVVLIGADKTGDDRFYEWVVPRAEAIFREYLSSNRD